jgi:hypothetical protein
MLKKLRHPRTFAARWIAGSPPRVSTTLHSTRIQPDDP